MNSSGKIALLTAILAAPSAASAATVPVRYTIDRTAFRAAVAGTPLTFELHATSACNSPIHTELVNAENVELIEKITTIKVKNGPRPPKAGRLSHTLTGVADSTVYYLQVTGTGISAVGGACQPQFAPQDIVGGGGTVLPCASQVGDEVYFTGCNVNIRSGSGSTSGPVNGLGNLLVGYNENPFAAPRTGSHNLVVGAQHAFSSYGGVVAGFSNAILAPSSAVTGGRLNTAAADFAVVGGGWQNTASGTASAVNGGHLNIAGADSSVVSAGLSNTANNQYAVVSGGGSNLASGYGATVSGGAFNTASGVGSVVSAGNSNQASGSNASVSGGWQNTASGQLTSISGGVSNNAVGQWATVNGGELNTAGGQFSTVSGGANRSAPGSDDWVGGGLFQNN